jgi:hypothetical protein
VKIGPLPPEILADMEAERAYWRERTGISAMDKGAGKPAGTSSVGEGTDPQGWPTQVACPRDNNLTPHTTAAQESSSVQPVVNSGGVATATGPSRGL